MHGTLFVATAIIGFTCLFAGCADSATSGPRRTGEAAAGTGPFVHVVFFDLKPGTSPAASDKLVEDAYRLLAKIPTVRRLDSGPRVLEMQREVNDQTFSIGLAVYFDDKAGHDVYATHPLHVDFIEQNKEHWGKVRVFDFVAPRSTQ